MRLRFPRTSASAAACSSIPRRRRARRPPFRAARGATTTRFRGRRSCRRRRRSACCRAASCVSPEAASSMPKLMWAQQRFQSELAPQAVNPTTLGFGRLLLPPGSPYYPTGLGLTGNLDVRYRSEPLGPRISGGVADQGRALVGWRGDAAGWADRLRPRARARPCDQRIPQGLYRCARDRRRVRDWPREPVRRLGCNGNALLADSELRGVARRRRRRAIPSTCARAAISRNGATGRSASQWAPKRVASRSATRRRRSSAARRWNRERLLRRGRGQAPLAGGLHGAGIAAAPKLEALLAARTDHFSDFGTTTSPKAGLRWQPATVDGPAWLGRSRLSCAVARRALRAAGLQRSCRRGRPIRCAARSPARRRTATSRRRLVSAGTRACSR